MSLKTINENPTITDTIQFAIDCPDANNCFQVDPYKIKSISIYHMERDFLGTNWGEYDNVVIDNTLEQQIRDMQKLVCDDPTNQANFLKLQQLQDELSIKAQHSISYYKDAVKIATFGDQSCVDPLLCDPVWYRGELRTWTWTNSVGVSYTVVSRFVGLEDNYVRLVNETIVTTLLYSQLSEDDQKYVQEYLDSIYVTKVLTDSDDNTVYAKFLFEWSPNGTIREGDYVICWTWQPNPSPETFSASTYFLVEGDGRAVVSIPTHLTPEGKYNTLLDRYLPEMYKVDLVDQDLTPQVTDQLNQVVAKGFTFIEDMANQIIDLFDANVLHESLLNYLGNLFDLRFKSEDPVLWRRQIKEAIPLFKKKGTLSGLQQAFAQAGMRLDRYAPLWQVVSPYTWTESFLVADSPTFILAKTPISTITDNFQLAVRRDGSDVYEEVDIDCVIFEEKDCQYFITWVGDEKSMSPVYLYSGDILWIKYQYTEMPIGAQTIEDYIQRKDGVGLTLADVRDETDQLYPPKNWNVRVVEEDDVLFDVLVPVRHPFCDPLIFGYVRTEFPFSENIYNMEEYNGSTRESFDACYMDKSFIDPCGNCFGSKYNIDVSVNNLSDDRLHEIRDILKEYTPFITVPHMINFYGEVIDFFPAPVENIEFLVQFTLQEDIISGGANPFFYRVMHQGYTKPVLNSDGTIYHDESGYPIIIPETWVVDREALASETEVVSMQEGIVYNQSVCITTPNVVLSDVGLHSDSHILEILSTYNAGVYHLDSIDGNTGVVNSVCSRSGGYTNIIEPLDTSIFTFNLSNILYTTDVVRIKQSNQYLFQDDSQVFSQFSMRTIWDVEGFGNPGVWDDTLGRYVQVWDATLDPARYVDIWSVHLTDYDLTFGIVKIDGDVLYVENDLLNEMPFDSLSDVRYVLLDGDGNEVFSSDSGYWNVRYMAEIEIFDTSDIVLRQNTYVVHGDIVLYDNDEYKVDIRKHNGRLIIDDYNGGDTGLVTISVLRRLARNEIGYFQYQGMRLITTIDYETGLGILNGGHPTTDENLITDNSQFKENFLVRIYSDYEDPAPATSEFYRMVQINGTEITLSGLPLDWMTFGAKKSDGTPWPPTTIYFDIHQFKSGTVETQWTVFDQIDRRGKDPVVRQIESKVTEDIALTALALPKQNGFEEFTRHEEGVSFEIEYRNGQKQQGEI